MSDKAERAKRTKALAGLDEAGGERGRERFAGGRSWSGFREFREWYDGYRGEGAWTEKEGELLERDRKKDLLTAAEQTVLYAVRDRRAHEADQQ